MKLAATSRRYQLMEIFFQESESELKYLMDEEIAVYFTNRRERPFNRPAQSIFAPQRSR